MPFDINFLDVVTWQLFWNWMKIYREDLRYLKPRRKKFAVFQQKNLYQTTFFNFFYLVIEELRYWTCTTLVLTVSYTSRIGHY